MTATMAAPARPLVATDRAVAVAIEAREYLASDLERLLAGDLPLGGGTEAMEDALDAIVRHLLDESVAIGAVEYAVLGPVHPVETIAGRLDGLVERDRAVLVGFGAAQEGDHTAASDHA